MIATRTVQDFMGARLVSVTPQTGIHEAIRLLLEEHVSGLPVVDEKGRPVGFLSEKDCFKVAFCCGYYQDRGGPVSDYMSRSAVTVNAETDIATVAEMFLNGPYRRFPVVSAERVIGVITRREALKALIEIC